MIWSGLKFRITHDTSIRLQVNVNHMWVKSGAHEKVRAPGKMQL